MTERITRVAASLDGGGIGRLHEQLILVDAEVGLRAVGPTGEQHRAAGAADGQRQFVRTEAAFAERFTQDELAQILSSQRITTGGSAVPGTTMIWRRTSR